MLEGRLAGEALPGPPARRGAPSSSAAAATAAASAAAANEKKRRAAVVRAAQARSQYFRHQRRLRRFCSPLRPVLGARRPHLVVVSSGGVVVVSQQLQPPPSIHFRRHGLVFAAPGFDINLRATRRRGSVPGDAANLRRLGGALLELELLEFEFECFFFVEGPPAVAADRGRRKGIPDLPRRRRRAQQEAAPEDQAAALGRF